MNDCFEALLHQLAQATMPQAIFGELSTLELANLRQRYHQLAAILHPDRNPDRRDEATEAFQRLQRWYKTAQWEVEHRNQPVQIEVQTRRNRYVGYLHPLPGDLCDLYPAESVQEDPACGRVMLKVVRNARNNDLMQNEANVLRRIDKALHNQPLRAHFPSLIDTCQVRDETGVQRAVNILADLRDANPDRNYVSLAAVLRAYPQGLALADAAWMWNRLLAALGSVHNLGLVHGAVTLDHLLIRPEDHNAILLDWCYSVEQGEPLKAISPAYRSDYPPEVPAKQAASPATDLYMAAHLLRRLLGPVTGTATAIPKPLQRLLDACLILAPARRMSDAWEVYDAFQEILQQLYGERKFRVFRMPNQS